MGSPVSTNSKAVSKVSRLEIGLGVFTNIVGLGPFIHNVALIMFENSVI